MPACALLAGLALMGCLAQDPACAPPNTPPVRYLRAIVRRESNGNHLAIRDETTAESLFPRTHAEARAQIERRLARGHLLGIGWPQMTGAANWRRHGWLRPDGTLDVDAALDPCRQVRALADHLEGEVLTAALGAYNGGVRGARGEIPAASAYARAVRAEILRSDNDGAMPAAPSPPPPPGPCGMRPPPFDGWATSAFFACLRNPPPAAAPSAASGKEAPAAAASTSLAEINP